MSGNAAYHGEAPGSVAAVRERAFSRALDESRKVLEIMEGRHLRSLKNQLRMTPSTQNREPFSQRDICGRWLLSPETTGRGRDSSANTSGPW